MPAPPAMPAPLRRPFQTCVDHLPCRPRSVPNLQYAPPIPDMRLCALARLQCAHDHLRGPHLPSIAASESLSRRHTAGHTAGPSTACHAPRRATGARLLQQLLHACAYGAACCRRAGAETTPRAPASARAGSSVCVYVCVCARARARARACVCVCVCVCVCCLGLAGAEGAGQLAGEEGLATAGRA